MIVLLSRQQLSIARNAGRRWHHHVYHRHLRSGIRILLTAIIREAAAQHRVTHIGIIGAILTLASKRRRSLHLVTGAARSTTRTTCDCSRSYRPEAIIHICTCGFIQSSQRPQFRQRLLELDAKLVDALSRVVHEDAKDGTL